MTTAYDFAVLRLVPHVCLGTFVNIGVIVHSRTAEYLEMRVASDPAKLRACAPDIDTELLGRYLSVLEALCRGDAAAGPLALLPPSERFHWLTAPRSDVLQSSPVHEGVCDEPARALEELFERYVPGAA